MEIHVAWHRPGLLSAVALATGLAVVPAAPAHAAPAPSALAHAAPVHTVPAAAGNTILGWGSNFFGELGDGTHTDSHLPKLVPIPGTSTFTVVRSQLDSIAVTSSGGLYAWGYNDDGQLGDGSTTIRLTPARVQLPKGIKVKAARAGGTFTLALTTRGKLLAWGANYAGQLGNASSTARHRPVWVKLPKGVQVTAISAGLASAFALTSTGKLLSWGWNASGQLGTGTTKSRSVPGWVKLPARTKITSIASGSTSNFAVTSTGRLLAWGDNQDGQLGDGTLKQRDTPVRVKLPAGIRVIATAAGSLHTLALTTRGLVLAWGDNLNGQLGNNSTTDRHKAVWVKLPAGVKVTALVAGKYFSMALTADHRILTWGSNQAGDLGDGTRLDSHVPVFASLPLGFTPKAIGAGFGSETALAIGASSG
jgi:alpha-tubulin suppressor-like RCC1 family protein